MGMRCQNVSDAITVNNGVTNNRRVICRVLLAKHPELIVPNMPHSLPKHPAQLAETSRPNFAKLLRDASY